MRHIHNCSATGIIHQASAPANLLLDVKTPGYPILTYVGAGLLPGGNWVRPNATNDRTPLGTYRREILEELTLENAAFDQEEMNELFGKGHLGHAPTARNIKATSEDKQILADIVTVIHSRAKPYGAFIQTVEKSIFNMKNPQNKQGRYEGLCHVFTVPLSDQEWSSLVDLQHRFGNISNEAQSMVTSLEDIIAKNIPIGWGQDRILKKFFKEHGLSEADQMLLMSNTQAEQVSFENSYDEVLKRYQVEKIPEGVVLASA